MQRRIKACADFGFGVLANWRSTASEPQHLSAEKRLCLLIVKAFATMASLAGLNGSLPADCICNLNKPHRYAKRSSLKCQGSADIWCHSWLSSLITCTFCHLPHSTRDRGYRQRGESQSMRTDRCRTCSASMILMHDISPLDSHNVGVWDMCSSGVGSL